MLKGNYACFKDRSRERNLITTRKGMKWKRGVTWVAEKGANITSSPHNMEVATTWIALSPSICRTKGGESIKSGVTGCLNQLEGSKSHQMGRDCIVRGEELEKERDRENWNARYDLVSKTSWLDWASSSGDIIKMVVSAQWGGWNTRTRRRRP